MKLKKIISFLSCMVLIILFFTACNEKIDVAYDKSTNTANISSSADFEWVDLNFKVTTKEFGEDYVTIKVRDIKENTIKKVNVITKYHKKDITIENIEYIGYSTISEGEIIIYGFLLFITFSVSFSGVVYSFYQLKRAKAIMKDKAKAFQKNVGE